MTAFVKPLMLSVFAAGSLALAGGQQEAPQPPQPPAGPGLPGMGGRGGTAVGRSGPGGEGGGFFGPGGLFGEAGLAPMRPFGDDPWLRKAAKELAEASRDDVRDKLRGQIKEALAKAFDERQKGQEKQVEELEKQVKRLKETVGKRKEAKADIIADRLTALEKEAKGLGW